MPVPGAGGPGLLPATSGPVQAVPVPTGTRALSTFRAFGPPSLHGFQMPAGPRQHGLRRDPLRPAASHGIQCPASCCFSQVRTSTGPGSIPASAANHSET